MAFIDPRDPGPLPKGGGDSNACPGPPLPGPPDGGEAGTSQPSDEKSLPTGYSSTSESGISERSGSGLDGDETLNLTGRYPVASTSESSAPPRISDPNEPVHHEDEGSEERVNHESSSETSGSPTRDDAQLPLSDSSELNFEDFAVWIEAVGDGENNEESVSARWLS